MAAYGAVPHYSGKKSTSLVVPQLLSEVWRKCRSEPKNAQSTCEPFLVAKISTKRHFGPRE